MPQAPVLEYVVRRDHTVEAIDGPWEEFAAANDAPELGRDRVLGRSLHDLLEGGRSMEIYDALIQRVLELGVAVRFPYRCDGPECRRFMEMAIEPMDGDRVRFRSRTVREEARPAVAILQRETLRDAEDLAHVCGWCKRFRTEADEWVEVEELAAHSEVMSRYRFPRLSHGICPSCSERMESALAPAS